MYLPSAPYSQLHFGLLVIFDDINLYNAITLPIRWLNMHNYCIYVNAKGIEQN